MEELLKEKLKVRVNIFKKSNINFHTISIAQECGTSEWVVWLRLVHEVLVKLLTRAATM